nr:phage baseplate assembly protein V [uncultured Pseudogulbenkiania sp.]
MTDKTQAALLKFGDVVEVVDAGHVCVRFPDLDGMVSKPLKVVVARAHRDKAHHAPDVGAMVACVVDENAEDGVVLGEVYSDADTPATGNAALWYWKMADGSEFEFDRDTGKLRIKTTSDITVETAASANVKAATEITLDAPLVKVTQNLEIGGGISQGGGMGGEAVFQGLVKTLQDFIAQGKSFLGHRHKENDGGGLSDPPA